MSIWPAHWQAAPVSTSPELLRNIYVNLVDQCEQMLSVFFVVAAENVLCKNPVELAVHSAREFSVPCETDPYNTLVIGIALSDDITLLNEPVDGYRKCSRRNAQILGSLSHRSGFIGADSRKSMHFSNGKI